jgi:hypothetical protein
MPWIREEVERLRLIDPETGEPIDAVQIAADHAAERAALAGRLERANDLYIAGRIPPERYEREAEAVRVDLERLGDAEATLGVSPIRPEEWQTWTPADLGAYVRSILRSVTLGPDMRPVAAVWRVPEWRAP